MNLNICSDDNETIGRRSIYVSSTTVLLLIQIFISRACSRIKSHSPVYLFQRRHDACFDVRQLDFFKIGHSFVMPKLIASEKEQ
jgi:hypothetical protein